MTNCVCKMALKNLKEWALKPNTVSLNFKTLFQRSYTGLFNWEPQEKETHTGQKWAEDDYRLCRFVNKEKQVNPNWAVKLIAEIPPIPVKGRITCCDGGSGPTGHPKVYINLDKPGNHPCLYCGLRFFKEDDHH